jgi:uncharacterized protein (UPF0276 family)
MADPAMARPANPRARAVPAMPAPLGVGFACVPALPEALYTSGLIDFVEVTPELFHTEATIGERLELIPDGKSYDAARRRCGALPVAMHGVELSIGAAHGMSEPCLAMMDRLRHDWPFLWYSEHLHYQTALDNDGSVFNTGVPLPLPNTEEAACLVAGRAVHIRRRFAVPFLLENPAHYLPDLPADRRIRDEFRLMNRITALSGCGQLLDLHNLYCNALNFGFDPHTALARIKLESVGEIHVAGGSFSDGFYMDGHDGRVPEPVWDLLEQTLSRASRVTGVVFEILEEFVPRLGADAIARELECAKKIWQRHHPARDAAA